jgi:toxin ParE1/3/4
MPSYTFSKQAAADFAEILTFTVERWGDAQGRSYSEGFEVLFHILSSRPMMGRSATRVRPDLRRFEYESHVIFYKTLPTGILIQRLIHKSRALRKKDF